MRLHQLYNVTGAQTAQPNAMRKLVANAQALHAERMAEKAIQAEVNADLLETYLTVTDEILKGRRDA